jgi:hypothetical protein
MKIYSRRELDPMKCGTPGCECAGPLILCGRCHPGRPVRVSYDWTTGLLTGRCAKCEQHVFSIAVADTARQDGR